MDTASIILLISDLSHHQLLQLRAMTDGHPYAALAASASSAEHASNFGCYATSRRRQVIASFDIALPSESVIASLVFTHAWD
jgi:hypothetical protein